MTPERKDRPEISVIVPIYRVERFLPRCIDSILKQTFRNIEVILVDDGSDDGCPAICDAAAEKDARVRVIHQKNQGLSAARNAGIDAAQGSYIAFADSDDYMEPNMLEMMLEQMKKECAKWTHQEEDVLTKALFPQPAETFFKKREAKLYQIDHDLLDEENCVYPV